MRFDILLLCNNYKKGTLERWTKKDLIERYISENSVIRVVASRGGRWGVNNDSSW